MNNSAFPGSWPGPSSPIFGVGSGREPGGSPGWGPSWAQSRAWNALRRRRRLALQLRLARRPPTRPAPRSLSLFPAPSARQHPLWYSSGSHWMTRAWRIPRGGGRRGERKRESWLGQWAARPSARENCEASPVPLLAKRSLEGTGSRHSLQPEPPWLASSGLGNDAKK